MTAAERIAEKKERIKKAQDKISAEQAKIAKLKKEIEEIESLEVKGMLKELDMPIDELREFLKEFSGKKVKDTNESSTGDDGHESHL